MSAVQGAYSRDIYANGSRLFSDRVVAQAVAASGNITYDVETAGSDFLTVQGDMTGAAITDLTIAVQPYEEDGRTLSAVALTPLVASSPANVVGGGNVYALAKYDVYGLGRVRITWRNANAGGQTINRASWRLSGF